jgi:hypothetical protein
VRSVWRFQMARISRSAQHCSTHSCGAGAASAPATLHPVTFIGSRRTEWQALCGQAPIMQLPRLTPIQWADAPAAEWGLGSACLGLSCAGVPCLLHCFSSGIGGLPVAGSSDGASAALPPMLAGPADGPALILLVGASVYSVSCPRTVPRGKFGGIACMSLGSCSHVIAAFGERR